MYGKSMVDKILALVAGQDKLEADVADRAAQQGPLAEAERSRQQEAAEAAQAQQAEEQRRCGYLHR